MYAHSNITLFTSEIDYVIVPSMCLTPCFVVVSVPIEASGVLLCYEAPPESCTFTISNFDIDVTMILEVSALRNTLQHLSFFETGKNSAIADVKGL